MSKNRSELGQPKFCRPGQGRTIAIVGDVYRFLATGGETGGAYASFEALVPPGLAHSFRNESDAPARMIITVTPAGLEEMFFEVGTELAEGATTALPPRHEEIERLLAAAPRYGVEILAGQQPQ